MSSLGKGVAATAGRVSAVIVASALLIACSDAPTPDRWWKGNLHVHSLWSPDGDEFPELVAEWYRSRGYHFLGISDHNTMMDSDRWLFVGDVQQRTDGQGMARYVEHFGEDWPDLRGEGRKREVRLRTFDELADRFEIQGRFLLIPSEEVTADVHLNVANLEERILPSDEDDLVAMLGTVLGRVSRQSHEIGRPMLASLSHPRWRWLVTPEQMAAIKGLQLFEIYNPSPWTLGEEGQPSAEEAWDIANTIRIGEMGEPPFLGMATDDAHHFYGKVSQPGSAWIMVRAPELTRDAIIRAIQFGMFYATSGVLLEDIRFDPARGELAIDIRPEPGVQYTTDFVGTRVTADGLVVPHEVGIVLATAEGEQPRYRLSGRELYVRAVIRSSEIVEVERLEGQLQQAWVSPVGWESHLRPAAE
jgi:hypothetical protein